MGTPAVAGSAFRRRHTSYPSISGIMTSTTTTFGGGTALRASSIPAAPEPAFADDELTPRQLADRLGVSRSAVYYWIRHDQLQARQAPGGPHRGLVSR